MLQKMRELAAFRLSSSLKITGKKYGLLDSMTGGISEFRIQIWKRFRFRVHMCQGRSTPGISI